MALTKKLELELAAEGRGCLGKAADDEPVFVLRAADRSAPRAVREWARFAATQECPEEKLQGALQLADAMEDWQRRNGCKWPD